MKRLSVLALLTTGLLTACPQPTPPAPGTSSILLSCTPTSIAPAATSSCTATAKDSSGAALSAQPSFTWTSSDAGRGSVSAAGVVTGAAPGTTTINATADGVKSNDAVITVTSEAPTQESIGLSCTPVSIAVAATSTCTAVYKDASGTAVTPQPVFSWTTTDAGRGKVDGKGVVTGVAAGSVKINATARGIRSNDVSITITAPAAGGGTLITPPASAGSPMLINVLGINNAGHVLYTTEALDLPRLPIKKVWLYNGSTSTEIPVPELVKSRDDGCLTGDDSFFLRYANNPADNTTVIDYWNGSTLTRVLKLPLASNGFPEQGKLMGCNDSKQVAFTNTMYGDKRWVKVWKPGDKDVTTYDEDGNINFGIENTSGMASDGSIVTRQKSGFGIRSGSSWTPLSPDPAAADSFLYAYYLQKNGALVYADNTNLNVWPAPYTVPADKTALPAALAASQMQIRATNTSGRMLFSRAAVTPPETWAYNAGSIQKLSPTTLPDIAAVRSLAINDTGLIALSGKTSTGTLVVELIQAP